MKVFLMPVSRNVEMLNVHFVSIKCTESKVFSIKRHGRGLETIVYYSSRVENGRLTSVKFVARGRRDRELSSARGEKVIERGNDGPRP